MSTVAQDLLDTAPALAFLCLGVPYAALLDRLGCFDAAVTWLGARTRSNGVRTALLWTVAALVTALLNLDTTIVLLTPIAVRLARRTDTDPVVVAAVPLLLSGLASSFLPVSNLTTLIVQGRSDVTNVDVLTTLGPAGLIAVIAGWLIHRTRAPRRLDVGGSSEPDPVALRIGTVVVLVTVGGFVLGPVIGLHPWMVLLVVDAVLITYLRWMPWRDIPIGTAVAVGALVVVVSLSGVGPGTWLSGDGAGPTAVSALTGAGTANLINNLPATIVGLGSVTSMSDGSWGWLWGVNAGSLLLPWGTLATVLWWRVLRSEDVAVDLRSYLRTVVPVALPAFLAGTAALVVTLRLA